MAGERQILRAPRQEGLAEELEVLVDAPKLAEAPTEPLKVLVYFHGHGGDCCQNAPASAAGHAVVALQCPDFPHAEDRCFWFVEGPGGAWDRHEHHKLRQSSVMLKAVS